MTKQKHVGLVVYAFGTPHSNDSNKALAGYVCQFIIQHPNIKFLIYTQNDIQFEDSECLKITYFSQLHDEDAPPTLRIARGAAQWARHRVDKVIVVAATPHRWRSLRDTRKAFEEAVVSIPIDIANFKHPDYIYGDEMSYWFDPKGTQIRAASRIHWEQRERILRLMPYPIYRMIAK